MDDLPTQAARAGSGRTLPSGTGWVMITLVGVLGVIGWVGLGLWSATYGIVTISEGGNEESAALHLLVGISMLSILLVAVFWDLLSPPKPDPAEPAGRRDFLSESLWD